MQKDADVTANQETTDKLQSMLSSAPPVGLTPEQRAAVGEAKKQARELLDKPRKQAEKDRRREANRRAKASKKRNRK